MMQKKNGAGHLAALFTIIVWGTTFISTKVLLRDFQPVEILVIRFVIGYLLLLAAKPGWVRLKEKKQEWLFAGAGLCGICLYFLLEKYSFDLYTCIECRSHHLGGSFFYGHFDAYFYERRGQAAAVVLFGVRSCDWRNLYDQL